ncbi:MAG: citrate lyase holo-[acyl-carrier protein] synthase [Prevotellaceae bacterium]|nr:citrate lyase holo-[acyl-carrier protein] synthase [Prevotella sp.]MDD7256991.1 citrate lyase holo-[acyl-carrier protein] synthase [Prevotellaceae bacterium]
MMREITLDELLQSREQRWAMQQELIHSHPGLSLICLTVIMPGNVKRNSRSLTVARAAVEAMQQHFAGNTVHLSTRDLETGFEAYLLTSLSPAHAKRVACHIEDTHPLGRLFDADVIDRDGRPISRSSIGEAPRKCLLCNREARYCMRNHSHTQEELHRKIAEMIEAYVRRV